MAVHYQKSDAGRTEIRARAHELSRPARNLLLILDATKSGDEWVRLVQGASPADLQHLVDLSLVAVAATASASSRTERAAPAAASARPAGTPASVLSGPPSSAAPDGVDSMPAGSSAPGALEDAFHLLSYRELYDRLTEQARPRLGLLKGYRMVLDIEKCSGVDEIRALALRFIDDVRQAQGDAAARELRRLLGAPPNR